MPSSISHGATLDDQHSTVESTERKKQHDLGVQMPSSSSHGATLDDQHSTVESTERKKHFYPGVQGPRSSSHGATLDDQYSTVESTEPFTGKEKILSDFYKWLTDNYKSIRVVRLYIGKQQCRQSKSTKKVVVLVIDGFSVIREDSYNHQGQILSIICKLWKFLPTKEGINSIEPKPAPDHPFKSDVERCIQSVSENLFEKHSNLEIISASEFRLKDSGEKNTCLSERCIVFYCSCKGVVPLQETEFPKEIEGIKTDVREGFFHLLTNGNIFKSSKDVLRPLLMGASISKKDNKNGGTLGGFVTLNNGDVGFLTCAHVLCDLSGQCDLSASFDVVQPSHGVTGTNEVCGIHQNSICTSSGSNGCTIDAAVVKLTKDRVPERGLFAELTVDTLEENGYSLDNLPEYSTGDIRDSEKAARKMLPCVKWGAKTGFTKGLLCLKGTAARWIEKPINHTNLFSQTSIMYHNQLEIEGMSSTSFPLPGDSGALVFQIDPAETETKNHQLYCIGMVVGGVPKVNTIVTPIQPILDAFQVQMHKFTPERMDDT